MPLITLLHDISNSELVNFEFRILKKVKRLGTILASKFNAVYSIVSTSDENNISAHNY